MRKTELIELIDKLPEDTTFTKDVMWVILGETLTYNPPPITGPVTIRWDRKDLEVPISTISAAGLMQLADEKGFLRPYERILVEELPNGTSRIIGQREVIQLRPHMAFAAIGI